MGSHIDDDKKAETMVEGGKEENTEEHAEAETKAEEKEDAKAPKKGETNLDEKEDDTKAQIEAEVKEEEKEEKTETQVESETKAEEKEDSKAQTESVTRLDKEEDETKVKEDEQSEKDMDKDIKESENADSFINDIYETEGKQEQIGDLSDEKAEQANYILQVTVVEAADLVNKDKIGKSDPYVVVKFQDQEFRSPTVKNSLSPKWNFLSSFKVSADETDSIYFDVYDDDVLKADEPQGSFSISIPDAFDEDTNTKWFDLKDCKSGKIAVSFVFTEDVEEDKEAGEAAEKENISPIIEKKDLLSTIKQN